MPDAQQITDVPVNDTERLVIARCLNMVREMLASGYDLVDDGIGLLAELDSLKVRFLGPDLTLTGEAE